MIDFVLTLIRWIRLDFDGVRPGQYCRHDCGSWTPCRFRELRIGDVVRWKDGEDRGYGVVIEKPYVYWRKGRWGVIVEYFADEAVALSRAIGVEQQGVA